MFGGSTGNLEKLFAIRESFDNFLNTEKFGQLRPRKLPSSFKISSVLANVGVPYGSFLSQHADRFKKWRFGKLASQSGSNDWIGFEDRSSDLRFGKCVIKRGN